MADKWVQLQSEDGLDNLFPTSRLELLWTNSAPTTAISTTLSIPLSLAVYTFVYMYFRVYTDNNNSGYTTKLVRVGDENVQIYSTDDNATQHYSRWFTVSTTGINFIKSSSSKINIPVKIYGIK